ncbi:MAG TPA: hypothetical protein VFT88_13100 [Acidobacteriaceae bacterium]|nr:hypothetical protein [Acidobacteriaceae bacterium]
MIQLCRYILQGGNQCQQAAINGENYCRHHLVVRRTVAANTPKQNPYRIEKPLALVFPEDRAALMIDIFVVMQAFNEGELGPKGAKIFTHLLHECGVILRQGPLYEVDLENAVRRVVVTPEGEEIAPAKEVPEEDCASSDTRFAQEHESIGEKAVSGETVSEESSPTSLQDVEHPKVAVRCGPPSLPTSQKRDVGHPQEEEAVRCGPPSFPTSQKRDVGHPEVSGESADTVPHTSKSSLCGPPDDFGGCKDPCYIENVTRRREQYRQFATYELAAGLDPRPWEEFNPGKSRVRKPKTMAMAR